MKKKKETLGAERCANIVTFYINKLLGKQTSIGVDIGHLVLGVRNF